MVRMPSGGESQRPEQRNSHDESAHANRSTQCTVRIWHKHVRARKSTEKGGVVLSDARELEFGIQPQIESREAKSFGQRALWLDLDGDAHARLVSADDSLLGRFTDQDL
jgi:hypothetical protein